MTEQLSKEEALILLSEELLTKFQPIVEKTLRKKRYNIVGEYRALVQNGLCYRCTEVEDSEYAHIFTIDVVLPTKNLCACDVATIASELDHFCQCDEDEFITVDGKDWFIGDGDDALAVTFHDNAFHVWVRNFKPDNA